MFCPELFFCAEYMFHVMLAVASNAVKTRILIRVFIFSEITDSIGEQRAVKIFSTIFIALQIITLQ